MSLKIQGQNPAPSKYITKCLKGVANYVTHSL